MEKRFDEKLEQAEKRFNQDFKEHRTDYSKLDLTPFLDAPNEKSVSLNALLEVDKSLMTDPHFMEMIHDINRFCSEDYCKKVAPIDKIYVCVAGHLKSLLRDCISLYSDMYIRKEMIEKAYSWYRDKRRKLLEFRLSVQQQDLKQRKERTKQSRSSSRKDSDNSSSRLGSSANVYHPESTTGSLSSTNEQPPGSTSSRRDEASIPSNVSPTLLDQEEPTGNLSELIQSTKRETNTKNVGHPSDPRVISFDVLSKPSNDPHIPFYASEEKQRKAAINHKLKQYCRRNLAKSYDERKEGTYGRDLNLTQPSPVPTTGRAIRSGNNTSITSKMSPYQDIYSMYTEDVKGTGSVEHVLNNWVSNRAKEAEEQIEEMEFRDAIHSWRINRGRIEEEIQRRQESQTYSSQTGTVIHKIKNYKLPTLIKRDNILDDSSDEETVQTSTDTNKSSTKNKIEEETFEDSELNSFISPYSSEYLATTLGLRPVETTPDQATPDPKGFIKPKVIDLSSTVPTSKFFTNEFSSSGSITQRSSTAQSTAIRPATTIGRSASASYKVISHNVFELFKQQEEKKAQIKKKVAPATAANPKKPSTPAKPTKDSKSTKKGGAETPAATPEPPPPEEEPIGQPPTLARNLAYEQCDKLKILLSKEGVFIPSSTLRRAMVKPEDAPHGECMKSLPKSSSTVVYVDCIEPPKKEKKKTKKKSRGGARR